VSESVSVSSLLESSEDVLASVSASSAEEDLLLHLPSGPTYFHSCGIDSVSWLLSAGGLSKQTSPSASNPEA
jgi:hypothetical protein